MTKATTSKIKLKNDLFKWQTLLAALTGDVFCRNSDSRCLLQLYQTTIWCDIKIRFFLLYNCFPLRGQLRCITIACNCYFSREKWTKASFSCMLFWAFLLFSQQLHVFSYKKNLYKNMSLKNLKTSRKS